MNEEAPNLEELTRSCRRNRRKKKKQCKAKEKPEVLQEKKRAVTTIDGGSTEQHSGLLVRSVSKAFKWRLG